MTAPARLRALQQAFWDLVSAPEGVASALRRERAGTAHPSTWARGDARLDAVARLEIYAGMYFYRLHDSLKEDYPRLAAAVGGARFHNLVTDFVLAHPPISWTLRDLGAPLPGYLASHALRDEFPFVADLAALEWARRDVFDAEDATPLERAALAGLDQAGLARRRWLLIPAARLLQVEWDVLPLWREIAMAEEDAAGDRSNAAVPGASCAAFAPPREAPAPARARGWVCVWRKGLVVLHRAAEEREAELLALLGREPAALPDLCERLLEREGVGEAPGRQAEIAKRLASWLDTWLSAGLLREAAPSREGGD